MRHDQPSILVVDDNPDFRKYIHRTFAEASWFVHEWDPKIHTLDFVDSLPCDSLTAALADRHLGDRVPYSGLEVLSAVRARSNRATCVLYTIHAGRADWNLIKDQAAKAEILALRPGSNTQNELYEKVVQEVKRRQSAFREPGPVMQDLEAWIQPDLLDPRLTQIIDSVGREHLALMIQALFPERGPHRPIRYTFLTPGFSGARVVLVTDPVGTANPGPRYILKVAAGDHGFVTLNREHRCFQDMILGRNPREQKLRGYVAEELRPSTDCPGPQSAGDWFGIAYREVGNGSGKILTFRELYLDAPNDGAIGTGHVQRLESFLDLLYVGCLGHSCHRAANIGIRPLWGSSDESGACYHLSASKRYEIFAALEVLERRAKNHLDAICGKATEQFISKVVAFIDNGRCGGSPYEPTVFQRTFPVLSAGTHGDLHAGNILALHRECGGLDPFVIDFSEYTESGHSFYDYVRLENDIRMRLMNYEDGSDILAELLPQWFREEEVQQQSLGEPAAANWDPLTASGSVAFTQKGYRLIRKIRALAYQNLVVGLNDQAIRPSRSSFNAQYISALLHRTLISLASSDVVEEKKILGLWLAARLISQLGESMRQVAQ